MRPGLLRNRDSQWSVLSKKTRLRLTERYNKVYLAPDRTEEERKVRRDLVERLKERQQRDPGKRFIIRRGEVVEAET